MGGTQRNIRYERELNEEGRDAEGSNTEIERENEVQYAKGRGIEIWHSIQMVSWAGWSIPR